MLDFDSFRALAAEAGFTADEVPLLWADVQPTLRTSTQEVADGALQIGGRPSLPVGAPWPTRQQASVGVPAEEQVGRPLSFVASLNLGQLSSHPYWSGPGEGQLLLFADFNEEYGGDIEGPGGACAVLVEDALACAPGERPASLSDEFDLPERHFDVEPFLCPPYLDAGMAAKGFDLEFGADLRWYTLEEVFEQAQGFTDLGGMWAFEGDAHRPRHQLLGNWLESHNEPYLSVVVEGVKPDDMRPLLQLSPDPRLGSLLQPNTRVTFALPADDLAAGRFDRVEAAMLTI